MKEYNVGIIGATGAVGTEAVRLLEERNFPVADLRLFASARSAGKTMRFRGNDIPLLPLTAENAAGSRAWTSRSSARGRPARASSPTWPWRPGRW